MAIFEAMRIFVNSYGLFCEPDSFIALVTSSNGKVGKYAKFGFFFSKSGDVEYVVVR